MLAQICTIAAESIGIWRGDGPTTITTHRKPGEIGALGIALELVADGGEGGACHVFHRWFGPPRARLALWHDNDGSEARAFFADGGGNAELRLEQAIGATFASAVKEEDDGPFLVGREPRKVSATVKNRRHMKNQRCLQE